MPTQTPRGDVITQPGVVPSLVVALPLRKKTWTASRQLVLGVTAKAFAAQGSSRDADSLSSSGSALMSQRTTWAGEQLASTEIAQRDGEITRQIAGLALAEARPAVVVPAVDATAEPMRLEGAQRAEPCTHDAHLPIEGDT